MIGTGTCERAGDDAGASDRVGRTGACARLGALGVAASLQALRGAGQCRNLRCRRVRGARPSGSRRRHFLLQGGANRPRRRRAGGAARRRAGRRARCRRHSRFRANESGRADRRVEGLHQGPLPRGRDSDRRLSAFLRSRRSARLCREPCAAGRGEGGRARRRKRRDGRDRSRHGAPGARRGFLRAGCLGRHRGVSRRRGGELLRALRWQDGDPLRHGAGPQARLRRRPRPEHRWHGRLFAGADPRRCDVQSA